MLLLNKSTSNEFALTLSEKATLATPYYLFVFTNDQTKTRKACIASVTTGTRYDTVTITESTTESLYNGTVSLVQPGYWSYKVYEQSSSTNLNPDLATNLLEQGKMKVVGTSRTVKRYNSERTSKAYTG